MPRSPGGYACLVVMALAMLMASPSLAPAHLLGGGGLGSRLSRLRPGTNGDKTPIHYDPAVLTPGVSRQRVLAAFGEPNATQGEGATREDVYAFKPDGSKFVDPHVTGATIAAAVFTAGMSLAVRKARIMIQESKLTLYHVHYDAQDKLKSVQVVPPKSDSGAAS